MRCLTSFEATPLFTTWVHIEGVGGHHHTASPRDWELLSTVVLESKKRGGGTTRGREVDDEGEDERGSPNSTCNVNSLDEDDEKQIWE